MFFTGLQFPGPHCLRCFSSLRFYTFLLNTYHAVDRATVTATASTAEKLNWLRSIPNGATHTVNYRTEDFAAEVKKTTNGKGVDVVIDFVGQSHWAKNVESLAIDGRMTILATMSGRHLLCLEVRKLLTKWSVRERSLHSQPWPDPLQASPYSRLHATLP